MTQNVTYTNKMLTFGDFRSKIVLCGHPLNFMIGLCTVQRKKNHHREEEEEDEFHV
ncbi:hypothetical protein M569_10051 [Genlisea aurea]|uniref:Uncharacterized protein n=1 Tax=Genlisea aurea TaxID=192259 RepID=S8CCN8_9LAMI|nr:hypothetical protein M569_10051 [Genlisea aurea]